MQYHAESMSRRQSATKASTNSSPFVGLLLARDPVTFIAIPHSLIACRR